ncbi:MAG: peptidylprolyl isomerase [Candidatus Cloacimonetes bacterium]|nr:peptidylprolyl isomerase [Candidatus Cloacimonadota bacterium]
MLRFKLIIVLVIMVEILWSIPIAWVEDLAIEGEEYQEKMAELPDTLNIVSKRQQALESMIEEKLLLLYGREQGTEVSEEEVEALFINTFSEHEMFQVNGAFSYDKFLEHKQSPRIQQILAKMHQDILIEKTRALVYRKLEKTDDELLDRFFLENVRIDVSYAQFDLEDVSISPQLTSRGARKYFNEHYAEYYGYPQVKLGLTFIPYNDFNQTAEHNLADSVPEITVFELMKEYAEGDSIDQSLLEQQAFAMNRQARETARQNEKKRLAAEEARLVRQYLSRDLPIRYPKLSTGFIDPETGAGKIQAALIRQGLEMQRGDVSKPYELEDGLIITWLIEKKQENKVALDKVKSKVWSDYIRDLDFQENIEEYRRYFFDHLEDFKVPTLIVNRVDLIERLHGRKWPLMKGKEHIIEQLEKYLFNEDYLAWVAEDNGLKCVKQPIYLEKYSFRDSIESRIAEMVESGTVYGVASGDGIESFFVLSSIYPRYIPEFDDLLASGYFQVELEHKSSEAAWQEYYSKHQKDMTTRDSVSLAGVYYKLEPDKIRLDSLEIEEYYQRNLGRFYHEAAVDCRFLVCRDEERAILASNYLRKGVDYDLVCWCFADTSYFLPDGMIEYQDLPEEIEKEVRNMPEQMYSKPIEIEDGWLIIGKQAEAAAGYFTIKEAQAEIEKKLRLFKADSVAYSLTKAVFDSTANFNDCARYAKQANIFKTPYQEFESDFPELGNLAKYKAALMRLYWNEKLTQIVKLNDGYAVIFMRKKQVAKELTYAEARTKIEGIFAANNKLERGKKYIRSIIDDLKRGASADSLLYFLGGMKREHNLSLDSNIPGFEQSSVLIQDMTNHDAGYYSPVLKVGEDRLMFYRINDIKKVSKQDFFRQKNTFRQQVEQKDYQEWLQNYREGKRIKR